MKKILEWVDRAPLAGFLLLALTLGLAPFVPQPHVWEKLQMLFIGDLHRPVDILDLLMHGLPWLALGLKLVRTAARP